MARFYGIETLGELSVLGTPREAGYKFTTVSAVELVGFRLYTPYAKTDITCNLWDDTQTVIATANVAQTEGNAWTEVYFETPITLIAEKEYAISCYVENSRYKCDIAACEISDKVNILCGVYGEVEGAYPYAISETSIYQIIDIICEDIKDETYTIKKSTLTSFGNQARRINGTTDKLTTSQMIEIFEGAGGGSGNSQTIKYATRFHSTFSDAIFPDNFEVILDCRDNGVRWLYEAFLRSNVHKVKIMGVLQTDVSFYSSFSLCQNLVEVDVSEMYGSPSTAHYLFYGCTSLKRIIGELDFSKMVNNFAYSFLSTTSLEEIRFKANSILLTIGFNHSNLLSDESIQSIIDGLATVETTQTLSLHGTVKAKLTESQKTQITSKNWTLA